jgi:hypothetical protein
LKSGSFKKAGGEELRQTYLHLTALWEDLARLAKEMQLPPRRIWPVGLETGVVIV